MATKAADIQKKKTVQRTHKVKKRSAAVGT